MMKTRIIQSICALALLVVPIFAVDSPSLRYEEWKVETGPEEARTFDVGHLTVPERHARPAGPTIDLAFVHLRSTSKSPGNPIVFLSGGPGQPASPMARSPQFLSSLEPLLAVGDVILLDQRGTGKSEPSLVCRWNESADPDIFSGSVEVLARYETKIRKCLDGFREKGIDLNAFNTEESADDVDTLRRALGAERIDIIGFSYGTHLGLATIRRHGDHLGRVVLIGTEGPDSTWKLPSTMDAQMAKLSLMVSVDPTVGKEVPDMRAALARILARFEKEPIRVAVSDRRTKKNVTMTIGADGLRRILLWDIGDGNDIPYFPALLYQLDHGETSLLAWFAGKRYNQLGGGISAMTLAMDCASGVSPLRRAEIEAEATTSLFGNVENASYTNWCGLFPNIDLGDAFRSPVVSPVPTLFVSGTIDSKTPSWQAERIRWGFVSSTHLIVENAGHEDMLPNPGVLKAIVDFLAGNDIETTRIVLPRPRFVSVTTKTR